MTATTTPGALELRDVGLALGDQTLLRGFSLVVAPGDVVTVMGPSGCGKSTLLNFVCGTLDPGIRSEGRACLGGVDVTRLPPERRRIGILFQDDLLFPHLSVGENLAFALPRGQRDRRRRRERVAEALEEAGLRGFEDRDPATLSGGQRARVALMRTLLAEPRALLLDEPFTKLDAELRERVRRFVFDHARAAGLPTLLVTHDPEDARAAGGPVVRFVPRGLGADLEEPPWVRVAAWPG
jgi:putative thiamine transport system ATP-binding protein